MELNQYEEMINVMKNSNAVTYEPNAHRVDLYCKGQKEKFFVSEQDGHLTIDYGILANALYNAGYCKASEVARETISQVVDKVNELMKDCTFKQILPYLKVLTEIQKIYENIKEKK